MEEILNLLSKVTNEARENKLISLAKRLEDLEDDLHHYMSRNAYAFCIKLEDSEQIRIKGRKISAIMKYNNEAIPEIFKKFFNDERIREIIVIQTIEEIRGLIAELGAILRQSLEDP